MKRHHYLAIVFFWLLSSLAFAGENVIEKQLKDIGSIPNDEVIVVQRQYTSKDWRWELTPLSFGGVPFGTVRSTLLAGASGTLHFNDWLGWEFLNFSYTQTFFSSFTDDINNNKVNPAQANIKPDYQKLLYFLTTGFQFTPFYGKVSTFSRFIAYIEPYLSVGGGMARTETNTYPTIYPGIGARIFFREWFSMKLEFRDYIYNENSLSISTNPTTTTNLRNNYAVFVAFSFWLPKMPL